LKPHIIASSLLLVALPGFAVTGTAYFSAPINWSTTGDLYYTVFGGPPNTCGDLYTLRNGEVLNSPGWLCTDANGNAVKGPWTWANTPGTQRDLGAKIKWPNGDSTNSLDHIWDKNCPTLTPTSPVGTPPSSFAGRADDIGAGFKQTWTEVTGTFRQVETDTFWKPGDTTYSRSPGSADVSPNVTGWPTGSFSQFTINWSFPQVPPASAHVPGYHYEWTVNMTDGDGNCHPTITRAFTAP
jgi:hypothetical protein